MPFSEKGKTADGENKAVVPRARGAGGGAGHEATERGTADATAALCPTAVLGCDALYQSKRRRSRTTETELYCTQKFLTVNQHGWKDGIQTGTESNSTANESYNNTIT